MRDDAPRVSFRWLKVSVAVLLVLLAVAPFCSAAPLRATHRQPTLRQAAGPSREVAETDPGMAIAPPPQCGELDRPAASGWLAPASEPAYLSLLCSSCRQSRAPPAR